MKRLLLALCTGLALMTASAANVALLTINGQPVNKAVASITFSGDKLNIIFDDASVSDADLEAATITFGEPTGLGEIAASSFFRFDAPVGDVLTLDGLDANTPVAIFDLSGKQVYGPAVLSGDAQINVSNLQPGAYLLRADKSVVKFIKK